MRVARIVFIVVVLAAVSLPAARAQFDKDYKSWYPHVGVGYSMPVGDSADFATDGWSINGGATYKPSTWPVGIIMDLAYNDWRIQSERLYDQSTGEKIADSGDVDAWSLTGGGVWAPTSGGKVGFYLSAAAGVYRLRARLTEPGTGCGICCDPIWPGWCWTCCGGVTVVTASESTTEFGGSVSAGLTLRTSAMGSTLFLECKYNYINTDNKATTWVPITLGYRW